MKSSKTILLLTTVWLLFSLTACTQEKTKINETKDMENSQKEKLVFKPKSEIEKRNLEVNFREKPQINKSNEGLTTLLLDLKKGKVERQSIRHSKNSTDFSDLKSMFERKKLMK